MNYKSISIPAAVLACFVAAPVFVFGGDAPLNFREDFKETPPETPITREHIATPGLLLGLHGPGGQQVKKSHHKNKEGDPWYVWSGQCKRPWAVSLQPEAYQINISGKGARFRWRTRQQGERQLRLLIKCSGDKWFVSDQSTTDTPDWAEAEFSVADLTWKALDITNIATLESDALPELKNVEAIGFTDLEAGQGSGACSRLDWIEVHGSKVAAAPNK